MLLASLMVSLMGMRVPDGLGVNIHFTDPRPGEMKMLAASGAKWVRMDFNWAGIERERGKYDFSAYDRLMAALKPHGIHALFILDYSNNLYDNGQSPASEEARQAFARWAAASARHFRGQGILWEMYNEPNIGFWRPRPDVDAYAKLALAVGKAIREAEPKETYIGPATSTIDMRFLEACFKAGLLEHWDAVSVHPYRQNAPETAADEYRRLRLLIAQYAPKGRQIPIISGEWGYSSVWGGMTEEKQGKMLPRQWLTNLSNNVPVSIWYDWHDDGTDPKEPEHHFGSTLNPYHEGRDPVYDPKPAYTAAKALTTALAGYRFSKRLQVGGPADYVLLFSKGNEVRVAAWTSAPEPHEVTVPASPGRFARVDHLGNRARAESEADAAGLRIQLTDAPAYLWPIGRNDLLRLAATGWQTLPLEVVTRGNERSTVRLRVTNPLSEPVTAALAWRLRTELSARPAWVVASGVERTTVIQPGKTAELALPLSVPRTSRPMGVLATLRVPGLPALSQESGLVVTDPLTVEVLPPMGETLPVEVASPSGGAFRGSISWAYGDSSANPPSPGGPVDLPASAGARTVVSIAIDRGRVASQGVRVLLTDDKRQRVAEVVLSGLRPVVELQELPADLSGAYTVVPDGDAAVASAQSVAIVDAPPGLPGAGTRAMKLDYSFQPGWKFARVVPQTPQLRAIEGKPRALGMWVYGDGQANLLRLRFTDSTGQTLQPGGPAVDWKGWRYVTLPLDGSQAGHWGGADDGVPHYPVHWDSLVLIDSATRNQTSGTVYIAAPTLIY